MRKVKNLVVLLAVLLSTAACKKDDAATPAPASKPKSTTTASFTETKVSLGTHKLITFSIIKNSKYLVVFESGMGGDHTIWDNSNIALKTSDSMDVVTYDRASYGGSEIGPGPRDISRLQSELGGIIDTFAKGRKVVLVGHSLGGFIIRDWAIKNPTKIAGLLFVDPSSEAFDKPTQEDQDVFYNSWLSYYGPKFGGTLEAKEWKNDVEYMATVGNLPDVPVIVLTAMRVETTFSATQRKAWYDAHELLGNGVTDFTNIGIPNSGHIIMLDQPQMVIDNVYKLLSKLP